MQQLQQVHLVGGITRGRRMVRAGDASYLPAVAVTAASAGAADAASAAWAQAVAGRAATATPEGSLTLPSAPERSPPAAAATALRRPWLQPTIAQRVDAAAVTGDTVALAAAIQSVYVHMRQANSYAGHASASASLSPPSRRRSGTTSTPAAQADASATGSGNGYGASARSASASPAASASRYYDAAAAAAAATSQRQRYEAGGAERADGGGSSIQAAAGTPGGGALSPDGSPRFGGVAFARARSLQSRTNEVGVGVDEPAAADGTGGTGSSLFTRHSPPHHTQYWQPQPPQAAAPALRSPPPSPRSLAEGPVGNSSAAGDANADADSGSAGAEEEVDPVTQAVVGVAGHGAMLVQPMPPATVAVALSEAADASGPSSGSTAGAGGAPRRPARRFVAARPAAVAPMRGRPALLVRGTSAAAESQGPPSAPAGTPTGAAASPSALAIRKAAAASADATAGKAADAGYVVLHQTTFLTPQFAAAAGGVVGAHVAGTSPRHRDDTQSSRSRSLSPRPAFSGDEAADAKRTSDLTTSDASQAVAGDICVGRAGEVLVGTATGSQRERPPSRSAIASPVRRGSSKGKRVHFAALGAPQLNEVAADQGISSNDGGPLAIACVPVDGENPDAESTAYAEVSFT